MSWTTESPSNSWEGFFDRLLAKRSRQAVSIWHLLVRTFLGSATPSVEAWDTDYGWHQWQHWLVGNTSHLRRFSWQVQNSDFVSENRGIYESWVRAMCQRARDLGECLPFLTLDACVGIQADACLWIRDGFEESLLDRDREQVKDHLSAFLEKARIAVLQARVAKPACFTAYLELLAMLSHRNDRLAMQLMDDVLTLPEA